MSTQKQQAFTLLELIVAMAIMAILIATAVPSFTEMMGRKKVDGFISEMVSAMQYSRSEAIARNAQVSLCTKSGTSCGGSGWSNGFLVFVDENANGSLDSADTLLKDSHMNFDSLTLSSTNYSSSITYRPDGSVAMNGGIAACSAYAYGVGIRINAVGRPRLTDTSSSC